MRARSHQHIKMAVTEADAPYIKLWILPPCPNHPGQLRFGSKETGDHGVPPPLRTHSPARR